MSANVETMAYAGQVPWHGLGTEIEPGISAREMLVAAGLDWEVATAKAQWRYYDEDGTKRQQTSEKIRVLYRTDTGADLSMVGPRYKPFQNEEILSFFQEYVEHGDAVIETAGSLNDGQVIWALADLGAGYNLGTAKNPDRVDGKVLLMNPHAYGKAAVLKMTEVRVVCNNTLTAALKDGMETVKLWHTREFDTDRQAEAKRRLGIAREQLEAAEQEARQLVRIGVEDPVAIRIVAHVMGGDTNVLEYGAQNRRTRRVLDLFNGMGTDSSLGVGMGSHLKSAQGTAWGLLNAVTQYMDHEYGHNVNNRIAHNWMGKGEALKRNVKRDLLALNI